MSVPLPSGAGAEEKRRLLARLLAEKAARPRSFPLSFPQQRVWFLDQLDPGSPAYQISTAFRLQGLLRSAALEAALREIVRRHKVLRTRFTTEEGEPVQVVERHVELTLPVVDLGGLPGAARQGELHRLVQDNPRTPFDLRHGHLVRSALLRLGGQEHAVLLATHHIVSDGWSIGVIVRELSALYPAFCAGLPSPLPRLPLQYTDYAAWQRQGLAGAGPDVSLGYWRERLRGAAPLELPTDHARPAVQTFRGAAVPISWPAELRDALAALGRRQGATLFMTLLALFQTLLGRFSGQEDVSVGTPIANRGRRELELLVGFFADTLVLRTDLSGDPPFRDLLARVRERCLEAFAHQDVPLERLVQEVQAERDFTRPPLFQALFSLQTEVAFELPGLALEAIESERETAKSELTLELMERPRGIEGLLEYNVDLFDRTTALRLVDALLRLLAAAVAAPETRVGALALLSPAERAALLSEWNDTAAAPLRAPLVHELVAARARQRPGDLAVAAPGERLTYGELAARAGRLARLLARLGVGPEARVGLCAGPTVHRVAGSLAVLWAGGAYVPLDPEAPPERLAFVVADSGAAVVLAERALAGRLASCAARIVDLEAAGEGEEEGLPAPAVSPDHLAYVVYTSGSTGRPKGVAVSHAGLSNLVRWHGAAYGVGPADRATLIANPAFDAAVWELWPYLAAGASLHVPEEEARLSPPAIVRFWRREGITRSFLPTPLAEEILAEGVPPGLSLRGLLCGGDRLHRAPGCDLPFPLINHYGPSEVSVVSTFAAVSPESPGAPPIGRPIANLRTSVVDPWGGLALRGCPGELWIGGPGLARGYLARPALTAERFVPDPWSGEAGERLYRTGDRVRLRPDGSLEFLGRFDHQVKLRGFRIELGEIESVLGALPGVREAAVALREDAPGDRRLVAYFTGEAEGEELCRRLRERLPEPMVPEAFVPLPALPLTPNGKLDRKALPAPDRGPKAAFVAPRTPVERTLAEIWEEVLGAGRVERIGAYDDFFALGGHSLLATRVASRVREAFGVEMPLRVLFESSTVAALAARIGPEGRGPRIPPLEAGPREGPRPLSFAQQRLWFLDQMTSGSPVYNIASAVRLSGRLDPRALAGSLTEIVRRHSVLRSVFAEAEGEPVQIVDPAEPVPLPAIDLAALPPALREAEAQRLARELARLPFDLGRAPMLRAALVRLAAEEHVASFTMHHIASDGWSMGVLIGEVSALYEALLAGRPSPLPELPVQYSDYALWQRGWLTAEVLAQELAYWRRALAGLPALQLPTDRPRPPLQTFRGAVRGFAVGEPVAAALKALGQRQGGTLFMVLLAAFAALLSRYSGQDDVAVGSPTANRTRPQVERLIGFFVNTLVLRTRLAGAPGFAALLAEVSRSSLEALAHQELPFEKVVFELQPERDLSISPLFQVMLSLQNVPAGNLSLPGLLLSPLPTETGTAKLDLTLDVAEQAGGLTGFLEYNTDLFDLPTVDRLLGCFGRLLEAVAAEPETIVADLPLLSESERDQLLVEWNATGRPVPSGCVHEWIAARAAERPDAVAVTFGGESLTYRELDRRANGLAWRLREQGVGPEVRVGLALERSLEMVVGLLGVWKAGGAYVPLDPSYPAERLAFMTEDSGVATVLRSPLHAEEAEEAPRAGVDPDNAAYVIYTSGSTGRPKGVQITHGALANFLVSLAERLRPSAEDVLVAVTSLSFDIAAMELYLPLMAGGRIVLASREEAADGRRLRELLAGATMFQSTPPTWRLLLDAGWQGGEGLRALCGGEAMTPALAASLLERVAVLWNGYGPTETTVCSTLEDVVEAAGPVAIGRPLANAQAYVLDGRGAPVPLGVPGELALAGAGLARGYLGRPELTAERFVPNPFGPPGSRMYRTGDRVRHRADGVLDFLGRLDHQVKIRGFRIELGEIEAALAGHPAVRAGVAMVRADRPEDPRLVAYVVVDPEGGSEGMAAELRGFLRKSLPDSMIPSSFVFLPALPRTPNGKVDRRALPAPDGGSAGSGGEHAAPATPVEEVLAGIWREVLGVPRVGRHDSFFDLGGHSLLLVDLRRKLEERFDRRFSMVEMFQHATISAMAGYLETPRPVEAPDRDKALLQGRARLKQRAGRLQGERGA